MTPMPFLAEGQPAKEVVTLSPGTIISRSNADQYAGYIAPPLRDAIDRGLRVKVVPTERLDWSSGFQAATEKYASQVRLDANDYLNHYVAGLPFPLVDENDPQAGVKIGYNWEYGPFEQDDRRITGYRELGFTYDAASGVAHREPACDHSAEEVDFLRYSHRTETDPKPTLGDNFEGVEWKLRVHGWEDPSHTTCLPSWDPEQNYQSIIVRTSDPKSGDEISYLGRSTRRVRTAVVKYFPFQGRYCWDPYSQPKTELFRYRLVAIKPLLGCVSADRATAGVDPDGSQLGETPFQVRQVYVLEVTPRDPSYRTHQGTDRQDR